GGAGHGLLGAVIARPDTGGVVLTGRLSLAAQPWLADHAVGGVVVLPGAGFVELVVRAGDEVGCERVQELVLAAPLVLAPGEAVSVQVVVDGAHDDGSRAVSVYSRSSRAGAGWMLHAEGMLGPTGGGAVGADLSVWPPLGAVGVDVSDVYPGLAGRGYEYGRAFQGLEAVWRRGREVFAEVIVPTDAGLQVQGFGIHPALLDAVLHAALTLDTNTGAMVLPFSWQDVTLHATGATHLRARIALLDTGDEGAGQAVSIEVADNTGVPVLSVGALLTRPVTTEQLQAAAAAAGGGQGLLELVWSPLVLDDSTGRDSDPVPVMSWNDFHATNTNTDTDTTDTATDTEAAGSAGGGGVVVWQCGGSGG
ncbi:polyketide synthase dehydratase domain-containing protein, partial [Mycobacterium riyadhense]